MAKPKQLKTFEDFVEDFVSNGERLDTWKSKTKRAGDVRYIEYKGAKLNWTRLCEVYWNYVNNEDASDILG